MTTGADGGERPVRRPLGVPGQPRAQEWLGSAPGVGVVGEAAAEEGEVVAAPVVPVTPGAFAAPGGAAPGGSAPGGARGVEPGPVASEALVVHQKSVPSTSGAGGGGRVSAAPVPVPAPPAPAPAPAAPASGPVGLEAADGPGLRAELEAILMVVDEPAREAHLASVLERSREEVASALRELSAEYTAQGRGFDLRLVAAWVAVLHSGRLRGGRRPLRPGRPAGPADPGRAGDSGGRRLPAAGVQITGLSRPWCEL